MALVDRDLPAVETIPQISINPDAMLEFLGRVVETCFDERLLEAFRNDPNFQPSHAKVELGIAPRKYEGESFTQIRSLEHIADTATIKAGALVGFNVKIHEGSYIDEGAVLENGSNVDMGVVIGKMAILRTGASIGDGAIIGKGAEIGYDQRVDYRAVVEPDEIRH